MAAPSATRQRNPDTQVDAADLAAGGSNGHGSRPGNLVKPDATGHRKSATSTTTADTAADPANADKSTDAA